MKFGNAMDRDRTLKRGIFPEIAALIFVLVAINGAESAVAQEAMSAPVISAKGPHSRVWSRTVQQKLSNGKVTTRIVPAFTELSGGMHYWSDEQKDWIESSGEIEVINGVGVARHGQHQVIWAANANTAGAVDLQSPDGKRFLSHVLGIAFTDRKTGASVFLATTKDSIGQVVGSQVIYKDAFDGISADIVYTYSPAKFEQDIVFREALPDPSGPPWNMNADSVLVEVYTEFIDPPDAVIKNVTLQSVTGPAARQAMVEPDLIDQQLDFGAMQIGAGTGFSNGDAGANDTSVSKSFEVRDQRHVLIEKIEYKAAIGRMAALAKPAALTKDQVAAIERSIKRDRNGVAHAALPGKPRLAARQEKRPIRTAQLSLPTHGFVMDYSQVNSATNVTLQGDTTYYVSGAVTLAGTTTLEGGSVVKYAPTNSASIKITGPVACITGPFRWVTFTARDDHTIGEVIGTNVISGYYANYGLDLDAITYGGSFTLTYVRVRYANTGINVFGGKGHAFSHVQLINCSNGYNSYLTDASFRNLLGCSLNRAFTATGGSNTTNIWEHVTLDQVQSFNTNSASTCFLTNCLLVAVTNSGSYSGSSNSTASASSSVFQAVGGGLRYLATNSPYRNMGTTNINPNLLTQLKTKTTYPPVIRTNSVTLNTTWVQQVQRDTDVPDIGYHYESTDYMCDSVAITNTTLTLASGTCVSG